MYNTMFRKIISGISLYSFFLCLIFTIVNLMAPLTPVTGIIAIIVGAAYIIIAPRYIAKLILKDIPFKN